MSLGAAAYAIANGAQGSDQTVLAFKRQAVLFFTTPTFASNLGNDTTIGPNLAHNVVAGVVDAASEQASQNATTHIVHQPSGPDQPTETVVAVVGFALEVRHHSVFDTREIARKFGEAMQRAVRGHVAEIEVSGECTGGLA